jgi:hypothetical protein
MSSGLDAPGAGRLDDEQCGGKAHKRVRIAAIPASSWGALHVSAVGRTAMPQPRWSDISKAPVLSLSPGNRAGVCA